LIGDSSMELAREVSDAEWKDEMEEFVSSARTELKPEMPLEMFRLLLPLLLLPALALGTFWIPWIFRRCFVRSPEKSTIKKYNKMQ